MDIKTLTSQTSEALTRMVAEAEAELRDLRFQMASNRLKQVRKVRELRKQVANVRRVLSEKK